MAKGGKSRGIAGLGVVGVLFNYAMARVAPGTAVRRLVPALGSPDSDTSTAAYMVLVKLGPRIAPHLLNAAGEGRQTAHVLQVLGDLGDKRIISALEEFAQSSDGAVATAARDSIEALRGDDMQ